MTVMIGIALVIMVIFSFLFFFSLMVRISKVTLLTASGLVGGFFIAYGDAENILILVILGWLLVAVAIIGFIVCYKNEKEVEAKAQREAHEKERKEKEEARIKEENDLAIKIYRKCCEKNINKDDLDFQRSLMIIARNCNIHELETALDYYEKGIELSDELDKENHHRRILELRQKEQEQFEREREIASIKGKDKYFISERSELKTLQSKCKSLEYIEQVAKGNMTYTAHQQDWAVAGGLASGLFGGATGLAVASDVQRRNAEERERAEEIREKSRETERDARELRSSLEKEIRELERMVKYIDSRTVDDLDIDDKFKNLEINDLKARILKSGNIEVSGSVKLKQEVELLGSKAILDGSLRIEVFDSNNNYLASGYYSAKGYGQKLSEACGFSKRSSAIFTTCIVNNRGLVKENDKFIIKIVPLNLWLIDL